MIATWRFKWNSWCLQYFHRKITRHNLVKNYSKKFHKSLQKCVLIYWRNDFTNFYCYGWTLYSIVALNGFLNCQWYRQKVNYLLFVCASLVTNIEKYEIMIYSYVLSVLPFTFACFWVIQRRKTNVRNKGYVRSCLEGQ